MGVIQLILIELQLLTRVDLAWHAQVSFNSDSLNSLRPWNKGFDPALSPSKATSWIPCWQLNASLLEVTFTGILSALCEALKIQYHMPQNRTHFLVSWPKISLSFISNVLITSSPCYHPPTQRLLHSIGTVYICCNLGSHRAILAQDLREGGQGWLYAIPLSLEQLGSQLVKSQEWLKTA